MTWQTQRRSDLVEAKASRTFGGGAAPGGPGTGGAHPACEKKVGWLAGAAVPTERQAGARARLHRLMVAAPTVAAPTVAAPTSALLGQGPTLDAGCLGLAVLDI